MRQGPLAGRYPAVAAMVMCALIPYLALSAALEPLSPIISHQLHVSAQAMSIGGGLANAAYAVGTVLAVQFAQHFPQRRVMIVYAVLLVIGGLLQATAQDAAMFLAGHIIQGFCTSLLLIAAVPPLAIGFPKDKLRDTAVIMNMCIFGAVALGPLVGGVQAQAHQWRPLFWIIAGIAVIALILAVLTFEDAPPANPDSPRDMPAIILAAIGCFAAFFGASELTTHKFLAPECIIPLIGGLAVIVVLVWYQAVARNPLLTIRSMLVSSIPVAGIVVALSAAAASVSATTLTVGVLTPHNSPVHIGLLYLPEVAGAVICAIALGIVIQRKAVHYLPLVGMVCLAAGIIVFRIHVPSTTATTLIGSGLTGIGLGATVAPALFVAGFSLPSGNLQRVFAIVELLRAVAAFMIAPIFVHFAATVGGSNVKGTGIALYIGLAIAAAGTFAGILIYAFSGARAQTPEIDTFLEGEEPAWHSPPLLAKLRGIDPSATVAAPVPDVAAATADTPTHAAEVAAEHHHVPAVVSAVPASNGASNGLATNGNGNGNGNGHLADAPVLIVYDGSELANSAIRQAADQLTGGRDAVVLCVWQPVDVGFEPANGRKFDADQAHEVHQAAHETALQGAALAEEAGFHVREMTVEASPTWKGIIATAEETGAGLIVIGSHRAGGLKGHMGGHVAAAVIARSKAPVLVVHPPV